MLKLMTFKDCTSGGRPVVDYGPRNKTGVIMISNKRCYPYTTKVWVGNLPKYHNNEKNSSSKDCNLKPNFFEKHSTLPNLPLSCILLPNLLC